MINFTRSLALEFASRGLRANCVAPGGIQTNMIARFIPREDFEQQLVAYYSPPKPGRLSQPEDIAASIAFLASRRSAHDQRRGTGVRRRDVGVMATDERRKMKDERERQRNAERRRVFGLSSLRLSSISHVDHQARHRSRRRARRASVHPATRAAAVTLRRVRAADQPAAHALARARRRRRATGSRSAWATRSSIWWPLSACSRPARSCTRSTRRSARAS